MRNSIIHQKSYAFALKVIRLYSFLTEKKKEYTLSNQLLRSGTSIWAMIREAEFGQSRADFVSKLSIALKEANESEYWLSLLYDSDFLSEEEFCSIHEDALEIVRILVASIKTTKSKKE